LKGGGSLEFRGYKINVIVLVIILVIVAFFSGKYLFNRYNIEKPLINELKEIEGVNDIHIIDNHNKKDIIIVFEKDINFFEVYQEAENVIDSTLSDKLGRVIIKNEEINKMDDVYYDMHYAIYEGVYTKKFVEMEKNIGKIAGIHELDNFKLWINNKAIFLQLEKDGASCYHRFPYDSSISVKTEGGVVNG